MSFEALIRIGIGNTKDLAGFCDATRDTVAHLDANAAHFPSDDDAAESTLAFRRLGDRG